MKTENQSITERNGRRILIVGGVAGGASCAARLRRLDENARITIFDKGPFVSFANCGLPYHVGGVIPDESSLILATPQLFQNRFGIDVRTRHEVVSIDRERKALRVRNLEEGTEAEEIYDALVLSPGAVPLSPPIPGLNLPGVFTVRTIPDTRVIRAWISEHSAKRAVVAGGGFIGLEMAENFRHLGLEVSLFEMAPQVMPPMDPEMVRPFENHIRANGVELLLGDAVAKIEKQEDGGLLVTSAPGVQRKADLVISALGVRPDTTLAKAAGLEIGARGGIKVDAQMRTSDPSIFAAGDAVEVTDILLGNSTLLALAGPANRQGRIIADVLCGRPSSFRGVQATAVCGMFGMAAASTGATEKALRRAEHTDYEKIYLHPKNHVGYYPGSEAIHLKVLYRKSDGRLLGAQACGMADVARKIDTIAAFLQMGGTLADLEEAEMCYAPQYGAAKDAINFVGMIGQNIRTGLSEIVSWEDAARMENPVYLDVRDPIEFEAGHAPGAVNLPVNDLRSRIGEVRELSKGRELLVYCQVGQRGYLAQRILTAHGIPSRNLSGGWLTAKSLLPPG